MIMIYDLTSYLKWLIDYFFKLAIGVGKLTFFLKPNYFFELTYTPNQRIEQTILHRLYVKKYFAFLSESMFRLHCNSIDPDQTASSAVYARLQCQSGT